MKQKGFAMIEVIVTSIILTIGISGMGVLLLRTIQGTQDSSQHSQAMWIVQDFVGRIRANPDGARGGNYEFLGGLDCTNRPAPLCADININGTRFPSSICTSAQMATFDRWVSVCGGNDNVFDSPSDFLSNPQLTSRCAVNHALRGCVRYEINLQWNTRLQQGGETAAERDFINNYSIEVEVN